MIGQDNSIKPSKYIHSDQLKNLDIVNWELVEVVGDENCSSHLEDHYQYYAILKNGTIVHVSWYGNDHDYERKIYEQYINSCHTRLDVSGYGRNWIKF